MKQVPVPVVYRWFTVVYDYSEAQIEHSLLSFQEKEEQKRQMKQSLEVYIQGVKDELRAKG